MKRACTTTEEYVMLGPSDTDNVGKNIRSLAMDTMRVVTHTHTHTHMIYV